MSSGTHVGVIGNVPEPDPKLKARIKRTLGEIRARKPLSPLVLHYGFGQRVHEVARDFARSMGDWRLFMHTDGNTGIVEACHILIVIAPGKEDASGPRSSRVWSLVNKAQASGRTIVHIPVIGRPKLDAQSKPARTARPQSPVKVPKNSRAWALRTGRADRIAGTTSSTYTDFLRKHVLPDSPKTRQLWAEYKRAAGLPSQSREDTAAVPSQRTSSKRSKRHRGDSQSAVRRVSGSDSMHQISREERIAALLREVNPPDPDVWRLRR